MLYTDCIKKPRRVEDGLRISVMSRHTLNDGITPDRQITEDLYDLWWPQLAPPPHLIGAYYKQNLPWDQFVSKYRDYITHPMQLRRIQELIAAAKRQDITLLCIEPVPDRCHRRLLAQVCARYSPGLPVVIN